jgi:hypothetical protein
MSLLILLLPACHAQTNDESTRQGGIQDPCAFVQRSSMTELIKSDWEGRNMSHLIQTCDSVCLLVYGAGNPDISGIGAMTSYAIQGLSTIILGPILAAICLARDMRRQDGKDSFFHLDTAFPQNPGRWMTGLIRMARRHHYNNSFIMVSISIALLIQLNTQYMPVAELDFVRSLAGFQVIMWVLSSLGTGYFVLPDPDGPNSWRAAFNVFHNFLTCGSYVYMFYIKEPPGAGTLVLRELTRLCHLHEKYPNPDHAFRRLPDEWPGPKFNLIFWPSLAGTAIAVMSLLWYFWWRWVIFCQWLHVRPRKFAGCLVLFPVLLGYSGVCVLEVVLLGWKRLYLQQVTGPASQDSGWGFGQVLAVLVWLPLAEECFVVFWGRHFSLHVHEAFVFWLLTALPTTRRAHTPGTKAILGVNNGQTGRWSNDSRIRANYM